MRIFFYITAGNFKHVCTFHTIPFVQAGVGYQEIEGATMGHRRASDSGER